MFLYKFKPLVGLALNTFQLGKKFCSPHSGVRSLVTSTVKFSMDEKFTSSQKAVMGLQEEPDNDTKLRLYALYKQGSEGKCKAPKPGTMEFVKKAKWNAWTGLGDMTQEEAKSEYIKLVSELLAEEQGESVGSSAETNEQTSCPGLKVTTGDGYLTIMFNRPDKKNALTSEMYLEITKLLKSSAEDPKIKFLVLRGAGDYYCSGNDLGNFAKGAMGGDLQKLADDAAVLLRNFVGAFIDFPKPLVAVVNGPVVGIAVTTLGLADLVLAIETATFHTPFSTLGQSPEGCSSYIFPKLMGYGKANDILMFNKKLTASEAAERNLVTKVYSSSTFESAVEARLKEMAQLSHQSLVTAKQLTRNAERDLLHRVNKEECDRLSKLWLSEDCMNAIAKFFQNKSKI